MELDEQLDREAPLEGTIYLDELPARIEAAWDAVPDGYIEDLYNSQYGRCQVVIDAAGGPTKYSKGLIDSISHRTALGVY